MSGTNPTAERIRIPDGRTTLPMVAEAEVPASQASTDAAELFRDFTCRSAPSPVRTLPLLVAAGGVAAAGVALGLAGSWSAAAGCGLSAMAGITAWWQVGKRARLDATTIALALDPARFGQRRQSLYEELSVLEDAQDLQSGVFEVGAELVGCVDEADARLRFAAAMRRYWSFSALDLWVWERGTWRCIGGEPSGEPLAPERPVQLPEGPGGILVLDLSTAVSGQAVLVLRGAAEQPSLVGRSAGDHRWVAEVLRSQLALSLRRVLLYGELNALARIDPLTGAHRRWYGETRLGELMEAGEIVSLAMVDIDHFKRVNDEHGHAAGDLVLAAVGRALNSQLRMGDLVYRYGGEEFLILLPDTPPAGAILVASRLRAAIAALMDLPCRVSVSVGVASSHLDETAPDLVQRADDAMYRAKAAGRDRVVMADETGDPRLRTVARRQRKPGESSAQRSTVRTTRNDYSD